MKVKLGLLVLLFISLHFFGAHLLYHQDEYKWSTTVDTTRATVSAGGIPHPPLGEFIYRAGGNLFGFDNLRFVPIIFGFANLFLLFYLVRIIFDKRTALWSVFLFVVSFYSLLASLMVDTDGAILPFFFLFTSIFYHKWKYSGFNSKKFLIIAIAFALLGFLIKVSFAICIGAIIFDYAFEKDIFSDRKKILKYITGLLVVLVTLVIVLFAARFLFPYFRLEWAFVYWEHFIKFTDRGWFQTGIQFAKAIMYTSPLLLLPLFLITKEIFKKTRVFFIFIFFGLFFYLVAFDFSTGALDRYFEFLVVPLCVISGAIFAKYFDQEIRTGKISVFIAILAVVFVFLVQFVPQIVPSLYPKTEWVSRLASFEWNFLFPFTGGSGPTGFYISFLFISLSWLFAVGFIMYGLWKGKAKREILMIVFVLGILYNAVFVEEYMFGKINGSPYLLFVRAEQFIATDKNIKSVVVYNDIGGYDIQKLGKYVRRMYAAPQFEDTYKSFLSTFSGHILYIDIPRIEKNSFYSDYIHSCRNIYSETDKYITAQILECKKP